MNDGNFAIFCVEAVTNNDEVLHIKCVIMVIYYGNMGGVPGYNI